MHFSIYNTLVLALVAPSALASYLANSNIKIVKTTTLPNGQIIDWISRESQGHIASPPPFSPHGDDFEALSVETFDAESQGPEGTVPILRSNGFNATMKQPPSVQKKSSRLDRRDSYAGRHWYASSYQHADGHGTSGTISMFKAWVENNADFSLLQTAVERNNVPGVSGSRLQTVEVGWINYPNMRPNPFLFTFFTTNGHQTYGDYLCSWNTDYKGWMQNDNSYYPGMQMTPLSVVGGDQREVSITVKLFSGNWWVGVNGKWIGYYQGDLFTKNGNSAASTLQSKSDQVNWYGEIAQSESYMTTTDMGSGHYASEGFGKAAYIRKIRMTDMNDNDYDYNGPSGADDNNRYTIDTHFKSGSDWGSYFFVGGPGAGGVIGG